MVCHFHGLLKKEDCKGGAPFAGVLGVFPSFHRTIGREFDLATATTRLMVGGVLEDFPELRFVVSHLGEGIAAILERIEGMGAEQYLTGTRLTKPLRHYFDKIYFNLAGFLGGINALRCALTTISPHRMVFGTDYPQNHQGRH